MATALGIAECAPGLAVSAAAIEHAGDLSERRRRALSEAVSELTAPATRSAQPRLAMRLYGEGCLALALAGEFDTAGLEGLRTLISELHSRAPHELVIDLSLLHACGPGVARALAQLRVQRLVAGARVELHNPPSELAAELGHAPAQSYDVVDGTHPSSPAPRRVSP